MERAVEIFAAINFLILGLSHVFQHRAWAEFFVRLHEQGRPGAFANGFLTLFTGSLIVAFHNVWSWPGVLLTAIGYSMLLKSAVVFIRPDWGLASMARVTPETSRSDVLAAIAGGRVRPLDLYAAYRRSGPADLQLRHRSTPLLDEIERFLAKVTLAQATIKGYRGVLAQVVIPATRATTVDELPELVATYKACANGACGVGALSHRASPIGSGNQGWMAGTFNFGGAPGDITAYALCAAVTP